MKVALVHEFINQFGGAERVLLALSKMYPKAPIQTLIYRECEATKPFRNLKINTSSLDKWFQLLGKKQKFLLPFFPYAVEQFNLSEYDLVISSSNSFAKGVITPPETIHICYCHSPTRYLWDYKNEYLNEQGLYNIKKILVSQLLDRLRIWDYQAAQRVDYFIANSKNVQKRIKKYYRRDGEVIYPPVNINNSKLQLKTKNYFLIVSRLSPYKKTDLAVEVFNALPKEKLKIIGEGSEINGLKKMAKSNIEFLGFLPDQKVKEHYANCRALIFPQEEDFGIAPIEAMASGTPVIAYKKGGALETILENKTGIFFEEQTASELYKAIERFKKIEKRFDPQTIQEHTRKFDQSIFRKKMSEFIGKTLRADDVKI